MGHKNKQLSHPSCSLASDFNDQSQSHNVSQMNYSDLGLILLEVVINRCYDDCTTEVIRSDIDDGNHCALTNAPNSE